MDIKKPEKEILHTNTASNENALIVLSLQGRREAFEELFNIHKCAIKGMLMKLSGSEFDANDLLQETFIKAFLNLNKFNNSYSFAQWLSTIARNTFIDYTRRRQAKGTKELNPFQEAEIPEESPEEIIIVAERRDEVEKEINSLPEHYREIIELRYYKGHSYEEIAVALKIPVGTVKTRLFRAKELLNKIFREQ